VDSAGDVLMPFILVFATEINELTVRHGEKVKHLVGDGVLRFPVLNRFPVHLTAEGHTGAKPAKISVQLLLSSGSVVAAVELPPNWRFSYLIIVQEDDILIQQNLPVPATDGLLAGSSVIPGALLYIHLYIVEPLIAIAGNAVGSGVRLPGAQWKHSAPTEAFVWYGTNRAPRVPGDLSKGFSAERDHTIHYGCCAVAIPKYHTIGSIGSSFWHRFLHGDDRLKLRSVSDLQAEIMWSQMRLRLLEFDRQMRHAVVFIHGYNVTFEGAAIRAAQLSVDLKIPALAFFSWPSRGRTRSYPPDEATIGASELAITEFLTQFAKLQDTDTRVHVIAHSMGNRALLRAMERIVAQAEARSGTQFNQVILAAPDVDRDEFTQLAAVYAEACERTTLYVSARDRALAASRWIHQESRVGYAPPVTILPGIDTINVTNIDLSLLGHGYVAAAKEVLYDMHDLIFNGTDPDRRMALRPCTEAGQRYWEIIP
jgi:esterase/lipase superfamily enzyme